MQPADSIIRRSSPFFWGLVLLSVVTLAAGAWGWQMQRAQTAKPAGPATTVPTRPAPDFTLTATDQTTLRLSDLRGKVVLLNFWATWCPPCEAELPDLNALHREYAEAQGFTVVGIDLEEAPADVSAFAEARGLTYPLLLDTDGAVTNDRFGVRSLPTSMIIDRDGVIRDTWVGQITRAAMLARLRKIW